MKIALIGAGHFVGARLVESFHLGGGPTLAAVAEHPAELIAAGRFAIDLRVADFYEPKSLARSFAGCSAVVHVHPLTHPEAKRSVAAVCVAAARSGVKRIVLLSSADVHGLCPKSDTDEQSPLRTRTDSESVNTLVSAERQFATDARELGISAYIVRAGFLYGPRSPVIAALASALREERVWLNNGDGISNCVYVDNVITAIRLALKTKAVSGSAFLITDAEAITWREFIDTAAEELRVPAATAPEDRPAEESPAAEFIPGFLARQRCTWRAPGQFAEEKLGYEANVPFAEGMRRSCAWWRFAQGEFSTVP